jgi:prepilin peptidase CpaA
MLASLLLTGLLLAACITDLRAFRIPNAIALAVIALVPIKAAVMADGIAWADHALACALMLALGFGAFAFGLVGGGDVKLLTALALWFGMTALPSLLTLTAIGGGLFALVLLALRFGASRLVPASGPEERGRPPRLLDRAAPVPYALPIAVAALLLEWS